MENIGIEELNDVINYLKKQLIILNVERQEMKSMIMFWEDKVRELAKFEVGMGIPKSQLILNIVERSNRPLSFHEISTIYEHIRGEKPNMQAAVKTMVKAGIIKKLKKDGKVLYGKVD